MNKITVELQKTWAKTHGKPVMAGSDWCVDWKSKHPGNCSGCPQEQNCHDFVAMITEILTGE